jgi:hypothetical protein
LPLTSLIASRLTEAWPLAGRRGIALRATLLPRAAALVLTLLSVLTGLASLTSANALAAGAGSPLPQVPAAALRAERLLPGEQIVLDGSLAHPAWQRASEHTRFTEQQPRNGAPPPQRTSVRVLFDNQALYVGVMAFDDQTDRIRDVPVRYDGVNRTQDFVVAYVDAIGHQSSAQFFRVNAAGSLADGLHTAADDSEDFSPDFDWDARVQRRPDGWSTVMRIPFASLRYAQPQAGAQPLPWRFMLGRRLPREQFHLMLSVELPRGSPSFIDKLQPLENVTVPAAAQFLTIRPSVTLRQTSERMGAGLPGRRDSAFESSLDVKWRPSAEWVIDGTLNPDFSQIALDVPQLSGNSRFALFLPEKRPFFFESADLLRSPTDALYTRSITQPRVGLRATLRSETWQGTALVASDKGGGNVLLPGTYGTDAVPQPASRVVAIRLRHAASAGDPVSWGGLLASRQYTEGRGANHVLGLDADARLPKGWRMRGQWLGSQTSALAQQGELREGPAENGHRAYLFLQHLDSGSETSLTLDHISSNFRHDTGFVNQNGTLGYTAHHAWKWERLGPFNSFDFYLDAGGTRDTRSGDAVERKAYLGFWTTGARNLEWWWEWHPVAEVRTQAGAAPLQQHFVASGLVYSPAPWWPLLDTNLNVGRLADTVANQERMGLRWRFSSKLRPGRTLELEPSISADWLTDDRSGSRRVVYRESAVRLLGVWHIDAEQHLRVIVQRQSLSRRAEPGIAAQHWGAQTGSVTWQRRISAGTQFFVGISREAQARGGPRATEAFVKVQLDGADLASAWRGLGR